MFGQQPQQSYFGLVSDPIGLEQRGPTGAYQSRGQTSRGGRWRGGRRGADLFDAALRAEARNRERQIDGLITNPSFWGAVFTTLNSNANVAEEVRRNLEEQERRASEARESRGNGGSRAQPPDTERQEESTGTETGPDRPTGAHSGGSEWRQNLPDLYNYLAGDFENIDHAKSGVQHLGLLMDELDVEALWSSRDVTISFGPLSRVLLRLFIGPYASAEENLIVRMLNLGMERASTNFGFEDSDRARGRAAAATEPFPVTYRRRGRMLRDFAAFRYVLEVTEQMGRIGRKHKNDLILLYFTLTTPEVRLHRKWNAEDRENVIAFRDRVTGYAITTPLIMARPMTIEMHLDSVFGNVSQNTRKLERSLLSALNNRNKKVNGLNAAQEVELLMDSARLLELSNGGDTNAMRTALKPFAIEREHAALRHMLEMSAVVSMMAEEYRVFVAGAPQASGAAGSSKRPSTSNDNNTKTRRPRQQYVFRRPLFFTFRPASQAMTNGDK